MKKDTNNILYSVVSAGVVWYLLNNLKSKAVDISKSIKRTFVNEGVWVPEDSHQAKDIGNYYPQRGTNRTYYGTNYGVTAAYLVEHFKILGIPLIDKNVIRNLTADQAREIFTKVVGGRMRYFEYKNQFVADFIFDWLVQRPDTCIEYLTREIFGYNKTDEKAERNRAQFSDRLINSINGSDPAALYNSLKFWRLWFLTYTETYRSFRPGIYKRIVKYDDFPRTPEVQLMINKAYEKAFNVTIPKARRELVKPKIIVSTES